MIRINPPSTTLWQKFLQSLKKREVTALPLGKKFTLQPEVLENRIAPASIASLSSGSISVNGDQGGAGEIETLVFTVSGVDLHITDAGGITPGSGFTFVSANEVSIALSSLTADFTVNTGTGADAVTFSDALTLPGHATVTTTGGAVTFANTLTLAANMTLTATAGGTVSLSSAASDISTSGTGAISLTTTRDIQMASGSSISTVNGNLTLSANAGGSTSGNFVGVNIAGGLVQATGTGVVSVTGEGGDTGAGNWGIGVYAGGDIIGGTTGTMTLSGTGGASTGDGGVGIRVNGAGSSITSGGSAVSLTGVGGGSGGSHFNWGIGIDDSALVSAGGAGAVTVDGTGGASTGGSNYGTFVNTGALVTSSGGNVSVTGIGGTVGAAQTGGGIYLDSSTITAGGTGSVTVVGTAPSATSLVSNGLDVRFTGSITSGGGNVTVTATGGPSTGSIAEGAGVRLFGDGQISAGGSGSVTVTGTGGAGTGSHHRGISVNGQGLTSNLAKIGAANGTTTITAIAGNTTSVALSVGASNTGRILTGSNNAITINADSVQIGGSGTINSGTATTTINTRTAGTFINLGGADVLTGSPLTLGLTDAELDLITAGTLQIGNSNSGAVTVSAAISHANHLSLTTGAGVSGSGGLTLGSGENLGITSGGAVNLTGAIVVPGTTTVAAGAGNNVTFSSASNDFSTVIITTGNNVSLTDSNALILGASTVSGTLGVTTSGAITQSGALAVTGAATLAAGAANNITLNNASNVLSTVGITSGATVSVRDDGGFDLAASNVSTLFTVESAGAITQSGSLSGTGGLTKNGAGTMTLSLSNGYTGATTVAAGTLLVNGSTNSASAVSVSNTATLGGSGTVNGTVSVASGGFLAPGNSPAILNSGSVTFTSGSTFTAEVNGATVGTLYDQLNVTGTVALGGATLSTSGTITSSAGQLITIIQNDGSDAITGTFAGLAEGATVTINSVNFVITYAGGTGNDVVLAQVESSVGLSGGNVTFSDLSGAATNDNLTITLVGANVRFNDPLNAMVAAGGATQVDAFTVDVPLASITGGITFNGSGGNDVLTVNFSGGNIIPSGGITYNGGAGGNDSLVVTGGTTTTVTHSFTNANDGSVTLAGAIAGTITYTGLEPITDNLSATDRVFTFTGGAETVTLVDDAGATMTIDSTLGESVTFANPSNSLTIDLTSGADALTVTSMDAAYAGSLTITSDGGDTATISAGLPTLSALTVSAATINLNSVSTTGAQSYTGAVTLQSGTTLASSGAGAVTLAGTVNGAFALAVNTSGTTTFSGDVGTGTALTSISTDAGGTTALNAANFFTTGAQTFNDAVTLGTNVVLDTTGGGAVTLASTLDGGFAFQVNTTGTTTFGGAVGGTTRLTSVNITGPGATALNGGTVNTTGAQTYSEAVTLGANTVLDSNGGGAIQFASTINGAFSLTASTSGAAALGGVVGAGTPLTALTLTAATINLNTVTTTGAQSYTGAVTLPTNTTLTTTNSNVSFSTTVDADAAASNRTLSIAAGTGAVSFGGAVGGTQALQSLTVSSAASATLGAVTTRSGGLSVTASAITLAGNIATDNGGPAGAVSFTGPVTLGANVAFDTDGSTDAGVTFSSTVDSDGTPRTLSITSGGGDVTFSNAVGNTNALQGLTIVSAGNANIGGVSTRSGGVAVTASTNINLSSPINTITGGTAGAVSLTGAIRLTGNASINTNAATTDANITIVGATNADGAGNNRTFTLDAGTGAISTTGNIGATQEVQTFTISSAASASLQQVRTRTGGVSVTATAITLGGTVNTSALAAAGPVSFTGAVTLGATVTVNSDSTTDGAISFSSTINGTTANTQALTLTAGTAAITLGGAIGGTTTLSNLTTTSGASALALPAISLGTNLSITTAGGAITQSGAHIISGTSSYTAGAAAITLTNGANNYTGAVSLSNSGANNVALTDTNAVVLGTIGVGTGTLAINAVGITQTGTITQAASAGAVTITGNAGAIALTGANNFTGSVALSNSGANAVSITDTNALSIGTSSVGTSTLTINAVGITQTGAITQTAGAGAVTITGNAGAVALTSANDFTGTVSVTNSGANAVSITDANALTIGASTIGTSTFTATAGTALTVSGAVTFGGGLSFSADGGDLTVSANLSKTAGVAATADLRATNSITFSGGADLTSTSGAMAVILNSDRDASGQGGVFLNSGGTTITTNGGDFTIGGGATPATTAAFGVTDKAIFMDTVTITTGAGNISIRGQGDATNGGGASIGVDISNSTSITTTSGNISITGTGGAANDAFSMGVSLFNGSSLNTATGTVTVTGTTTSTGTNAYGVKLQQNSKIEATGNGVITVSGTGSASGSGGSNDGVALFDNADIVSQGSGAISITGTAGAGSVAFNSGSGANDIQLGQGGAGTFSGALTISADTITIANASLGSTGALTVQPVTATTTVGIGNGSSGTFNLNTLEVSAFTNGFSSINIGRADGNANVDVRAITFNDPTKIQVPVGGTITVNGQITGTGDASITLDGAGATTVLLANIVTSGTTITISDSVQLAANSILLDTTNGGASAAGAAISITGTVDADAAVNTRNLTLTAGTAGTVAFGAVGATTRPDNFTISGLSTGALPAISLDGNLSITTTGAAITQSGVLTVGGTTTISAGANAVTLSNAANDFTGAVAVTNTGANNVSITDANALVLGTSSVGGTYTATSSGAITQTGALTIAGVATFAAGAANNITLNSANDFSTFAVTTGNNVSVTDANALILGASTVSGTLTVVTAGNITDSGALAVTGTTTLTPGAANSITLDNANNFSTVAITNGTNAALNDTGAIDLGAISITGTLGVTAAGAITDSGTLVIGGAATLAAGAANSITLDSAANDFASVGITNALNVTLVDVNAIALNASTVSGTLTITSAGAITDNGNVVVTGTTTLTPGAANSITLNNSNNFSTVVITNGTNATLVDSNAIDLGNISLTGTLSVTSAGNITDSGVLTIGSTATLAPGAANSITLDGANDFSSVTITNGTNATLNDVNAIAFVTINMTGALNVTAAGAISDVGNLVVGGAATFAAGAANSVTLDSSGNNFASVGITNALNVTLVDTNAIALNASTISGTLGVTSAGNITDNGALAVTGTTTLAPGAANSITLDNANNFSTVAITNGTNAALNDTGAIDLGAISITGTLGVTTAGVITDSGTLVIGGVATFAAGSGNDITLNSAASNFSTVTITSGNNVAVTDTNALILGASTVSGTFGVNTGGAVTQSGVLTVTGVTTVAAGSGNNITLNSANDFSTFAVTSGNNVSVTDANALVLGASTVSGTLAVTTSGALTQSGAVAVTSTSAFNSGAAAITLTNVGNNFVGAVALTNSGANNVSLVNSVALSVATSSVGTGTLSLTGAGITQTGTITQAAAAGAVTLTGGGAAINLALANNFTGAVTASTTGAAAAITINDATGGLNAASVTTTDGAITLSATSGNLTATTITAGGTTRNISLTTTTSGNVLLDNVTAASDTVTITSAGTIEESGADAGADVTAGTLSLTAATGIGAAGTIETALSNLSATSTTGGITLANTGVLTVTGLSAVTSGNITVSNVGAFTTSGAVTATSGTITLSAASPLTIGANITASGAIVLTAGEISDSPTFADDLTVNGGVTVQSTGSTVTLQAGDDIWLLAGSTVSGTAVIIQPGFGDLDGVGSAYLLGTIITSSAFSLSSTGDIVVGLINAAGNTVTLTADSDNNGTGGIFDTADGAVDIIADTLVLSSGLGIDIGPGTYGHSSTTAMLLQTQVNTLSATVANGSGDITIANTGALAVTTATTPSGSISIGATGGNLTVTTATAGGSGNITLSTTTSGNVLVDNVTAAGDTITITSAGAISESGADAGADLTANSLSLTAATGIGAAGTIETAVSILTGSTVTGGIDLANTGALSITSLAASTSGNITLTNTGSIALAGNVSAASGNVSLTTTANITRSAGTVSGTTVTFSATAGTVGASGAEVNTSATSLVIASSGDQFITDANGANVTSNATAGNITLTTTTGDWTINSTGVDASGTVNITASAGDILRSGVAADITGTTLTLTAGGADGDLGASGNALLTTGTAIAFAGTGTGDTFITETDGATVTGANGSGSTTLITSTNNWTINLTGVDATGDVTLIASAGDILRSGATADVTGSTLTFTAGGADGDVGVTGTALLTSGSSIVFTATGTGEVVITETDGANVSGSAATGNIVLTSTTGDWTVNSTGVDTTGNVTMTASAGDILRSGAAADITGGTLTLTAGGADGDLGASGNELLTAGAQINFAGAGTGDVFITESNGASVSGATGSGNISLTTTTGDWNVNLTGINTTGNVTVTASAGDIQRTGIFANIAANVVTLTAGGLDGDIGVGGTSPMITTATSIVFAGSGTGDVLITEANGANVSGSTGSGNITLISSSGDWTVNSTGVSTTGNVVMTATAGDLLLQAGNAAAVVAGNNVTLTAGGADGDIGASALPTNRFRTDATNLVFTGAGTGDVNITELTGATVTGATGSGQINLTTAAGDWTIIGSGLTTTGNQNITAISGDILRSGAGALITGAALTLFAGGADGDLGAAGTPLLTTVDSIVFTGGGTGDVFITESNGASINGSTGSGDVTLITTTGDWTVDSTGVDTAGDVTITASAGDILTSGGAAEISANLLTLTAGGADGDIGAIGSPIFTAATAISFTGTGTGEVLITEADGATITGTTGSGDITLINTLNDWTVVSTGVSTTGNVTMTSLDGDLLRTGALAVVAGNLLTLTAGGADGGIGTSAVNLLTTATTIAFTAAGTGNVDIAETNDAVVSGVTGAGNTETNLTAGGNWSLGLLNLSATNTVATIATGGAVLDINGAANNITALSAVFTTITGVGTLADMIETTLGSLEADGLNGGVFIAETDALTIGGISAMNGVTSQAGDIVITSGDLTIEETIETPVNVTLTSTGFITETLVGEINAVDLISTSVGIQTLTGPNTLTTFTATSTNAAITLNETDGLGLNAVNAGTGDVTITLTAGALADNNAGATNITGNIVILTAPDGIDADTAATTLTATSIDNNIELRELNDVALNLITAGVGDVTITAGGQITDNNAALNNIVAANLTLVSNTGITSIETDVDTVTASSINSNISINEADGLAVNLVDAGTGSVTLTLTLGALTDNNGAGTTNVAGDAVTLTAPAGIDLDTAATSLSATTSNANIVIRELDSVALGLVNAGAADVNLEAGGSITDNNGALNNILSNTLTISAVTGIDVDTTIDTLTSADVSGTGNIIINDLAGGLDVTTATTADGDITITANGGDLNVTLANASVNLNLSTSASGDVNVGDVTAGITVTIVADDEVNELAPNDAGADITALNANITAGTGIGTNSGGALETALTGTLNAETTTGGVFIDNAGTFTINDVTVNTSGNIVINGDEDITIAGTVNTTDDITISAVEFDDAAGPYTNNMTVTGTVGALTTNNVTLRAGDDLTIGATGIVNATTSIEVCAGYNDLDTRGELTLDGTINIVPGGGLILCAAGDIVFGTPAIPGNPVINAPGSSVTLTTMTGNIYDNNDNDKPTTSPIAGGFVIDVLAAVLTLNAPNGYIGEDGDTIETTVNSVSANAGGGGVFLWNTTALTVAAITAAGGTGGVSIDITSEGNLTINGPVSDTTGDDMTFFATGATADLTLNGTVTGSGDMTFNAGDQVLIGGLGVINNTGSLNVTLNAGFPDGDPLLPNNPLADLVISGALNLGSANLRLTAPRHVELNGGSADITTTGSFTVVADRDSSAIGTGGTFRQIGLDSTVQVSSVSITAADVELGGTIDAGVGDIDVFASLSASPIYLNNNGVGLNLSLSDLLALRTVGGPITIGETNNIGTVFIGGLGTVGIALVDANYTLNGGAIDFNGGISLHDDRTLTLNATSSGLITAAGGVVTDVFIAGPAGTLAINASGDVTLNTRVTNLGESSVLGDLILNNTNTDLTIIGDVETINADITVGAATIAIVTGFTLSSDAIGGDLRITADGITLDGDLAGGGVLTLRGNTIATTFGFGDGATGMFNMTVNEIANIQDGFDDIVIGRTGQTGDMHFLGGAGVEVTFTDSVQIIGGLGEVTIEETSLIGVGDASFDIDARRLVFTGTAPGIITDSQFIDINAGVVLESNTSIDSTAGGGVDGDITFIGTINGAFDFTVTADAGDIVFAGNPTPVPSGTSIGGEARLTSITASGAKVTLHCNIHTVGDQVYTGTEIVMSNGERVSDAGSLIFNGPTTVTRRIESYARTGSIIFNGDVNSGPAGTGTLILGADTVSFLGDVGNVQPLAGIQVSATGALDINGDFTSTNLIVDLNEINFTGGAGSVVISGVLEIKVKDAGTAFRVGGLETDLVGGAPTLNFSDADIAALADGIAAINLIQTGTSDIMVVAEAGEVHFLDPLTLRHTAKNGVIQIKGDLYGDSANGSITTKVGVTGATVLEASVFTTGGGNIDIYNGRVADDISLDSSAGGDVIIRGKWAAAAGGETLDVNSGAGDISIIGTLGLSGARSPVLGPVTLTSAGTTTFGTSISADSLTVNGGGVTKLAGAVTTTGAAGQSYGNPVQLAKSAGLTSKNAVGLISFASTIDSVAPKLNSLTISNRDAVAGATVIDVTGAVGASARLGTFRISTKGDAIVRDDIVAKGVSITAAAFSVEGVDTVVADTIVNSQIYRGVGTFNGAINSERLTINTTGNLTNNAAWNVSGVATINTDRDSDITITTFAPGNVFGSLSAFADNIDIETVGATTLKSITARTSFEINATGSVTLNSLRAAAEVIITSGGSISQAAGAIHAGELTVSAVGAVQLNGLFNNIRNIDSASAGTSLTIVTAGTGQIGLSGVISSGAGDILLAATRASFIYAGGTSISPGPGFKWTMYTTYVRTPSYDLELQFPPNTTELGTYPTPPSPGGNVIVYRIVS